MSRFAMIDEGELQKAADCHLSGRAWSVFVAIRLHHSQTRGYSWPGIKLLATLTGCDRSTVKRAIATLNKAGLIRTVYRPGLGNQYHLPICTCLLCSRIMLDSLTRDSRPIDGPADNLWITCG
jgi:DNA-binding transcriptional MocR family regulator